jgi:ribonucleotide monophosphatase NagD (HAD superfamily)
MTRPLSDLRGPVRALFSDVDGTMTTGERIEASTFDALEQLSASGTPVVMVPSTSENSARTGPRKSDKGRVMPRAL